MRVDEHLGEPWDKSDPKPASRWKARDGVIGSGTTLTVNRVVRPFPAAIRTPYVECYVAGELRWIPLDGRWGNGLQPVYDHDGETSA
jgi:hypothetical protein